MAFLLILMKKIFLEKKKEILEKENCGNKGVNCPKWAIAIEVLFHIPISLLVSS